ncbi:mitochondrial substrate carrier family protein [Heterostelium album PN500]|uniref:Mitochondrial substrate carrier family protein n=1 Tax=Heterostelium pallidum (strain ATCC 26659 / Pp 5 / PN500) TaxID=670386 RepID=D3AVN2_HETP5|nr:mitochondrial substrate carrier family protein [Heterostelium album PN500]EFA86355.1 mitochondrial substrate carrier family protein [Heterostelium album PN500]|eukprot:XP_020438460.1 mitochondrial substrate carrier family protein [Heterostelium album PN500]
MSTNTNINSSKKLNPFYDGISASIGSTVAIGILQPFDLLKIRLQGSGFAVESGASATGVKSSRPGLVSTFYSVLKNEGVSQFWRGIGPTVLASGVAWGVYMHFYESYKTAFKRFNNNGNTETVPLYQGFVAGVAAGASQVFITNPIFMIKTRMQLQVPGSESYYTGFIDGIRKTVAKEGFFGLYKGVVPALWLTFHGGIQMSTYDEMKSFFAKRSNKSVNQLSSSDIFIASSVSKFLASTMLYPFQVIKTRLQDERNIPTKDKTAVYNGTMDVAKKIYRSEGITGFYRGVIPNTLKVIPNSSITLLAYEEIRKLFISYDIGIKQQQQ